MLDLDPTLWIAFAAWMALGWAILRAVKFFPLEQGETWVVGYAATAVWPLTIVLLALESLSSAKK